MFIRQLQYLVTLSQTRHFGRAARTCHVSQPGLSAGIRHLEEELGVAIVRRGHRFQGFTSEGERLLAWARRILAGWEGLRQEASAAGKELTGILRIGAIPTAMSVVPLITGTIRASHPGVRQSLVSLSSDEILRQLNAFEIDLGVTYKEESRPEGFRALPLYRERYLLLAPANSPLGARKRMGWSEASRLPLCLLTPNMQNRRIVDAAFRSAEVRPRVVAETDSILALYSFVRHAGLYSIVPQNLLCLSELSREVAAIPLKPEVSRQVELLSIRDMPPPPVVAAAWSMVEHLELQSRLDGLITAAY